jgi:hypothetical protein
LGKITENMTRFAYQKIESLRVSEMKLQQIHMYRIGVFLLALKSSTTLLIAATLFWIAKGLSKRKAFLL